MARSTFIVPVLIASFALPGFGQGEDRDRSRDLVTLLDWIELEQSFSAAARAEATAAVDELLAEPVGLSEPAFYMAVRRIVALADNGHSNVALDPVVRTFGRLRLRVHWFADGLYVVRARKPRNFAGARIEAIEGRSTEAVAAELERYSGGTSELFRRYHAPILLLSPAVLHAVGLAERDDRLRLRVVRPNGREVERTVRSEPRPTPRFSPARLLSPERLPGEHRAWRTVLSPGDPVPFAIEHPEALFLYIALDDLVYLQLRQNSGSLLPGFIEDATRLLGEDRPRSIVFDNRYNPGGNFFLTADFALRLPDLVNGGRVYSITGHGTFSAGIYSAFFPEASRPRRTVIVGELVGDAPRFWAEGRSDFTLPDSGWTIGYALELHDLAEGCDEPACFLSPGSPANIAVGTFEPEIPVAETFSDYVAGRDAALEAALLLDAE